MTTDETRRFRVGARDPGAPHARVVTETSVEAAVVAWLEAWPGGASQRLSIVVHDLADGCEHCFAIELESGALGVDEARGGGGRQA